MATMKQLLIIVTSLVTLSTAVPQPEPHYLPPTIMTKHYETMYAPITETKYGSHINHLVQVPAPIYKSVPVPEPYTVPQPYEVPRPYPVEVPRPVPVEVKRIVPIPLVAKAEPIYTKSVIHAPPVLHHESAYSMPHPEPEPMAHPALSHSPPMVPHGGAEPLYTHSEPLTPHPEPLSGHGKSAVLAHTGPIVVQHLGHGYGHGMPYEGHSRTEPMPQEGAYPHQSHYIQ